MADDAPVPNLECNSTMVSLSMTTSLLAIASLPKLESTALPIQRPSKDFDFLAKLTVTETVYFPSRHFAEGNTLDKIFYPLVVGLSFMSPPLESLF